MLGKSTNSWYFQPKGEFLIDPGAIAYLLDQDCPAGGLQIAYRSQVVNVWHAGP